MLQHQDIHTQTRLKACTHICTNTHMPGHAFTYSKHTHVHILYTLYVKTREYLLSCALKLEK